MMFYKIDDNTEKLFKSVESDVSDVMLENWYKLFHLQGN